jgi:2-aminoethylphosphonate-pyruvate transaminase
MYECIPDNPYLLLTPGPLSTTKGVRAALLRDWCTWDEDYNLDIVQRIRGELVTLAASNPEDYTAVLMQGSGSFGVEACLGTAVPWDGKLLIVSNGAYGARMVREAEYIGRAFSHIRYPEAEAPDPDDIGEALGNDPAITHVAMVHCETTTGILNPIEEAARVVKAHGKTFIVDAMSSFGGIPIDMSALGVDYLISSSNKCVQGVPGFSFVIARRSELEKCEGNAHSLCLDLYDQWREMDEGGKWRFTSPTHVVRAFLEALSELREEGGIPARWARYRENQRILSEGMRVLGFRPLLPESVQSPIITSFLYPTPNFNFKSFYQAVKRAGFVIYPGKISQAPTFRIGNIGDVHPSDINRLLGAIENILCLVPM